MRKWIIGILIFISLLALVVRFGGQFYDFVRVKETAGIRVLSLPGEATVFINDQEVGKTPYQDDNQIAGAYAVRIEQAEAKWQGNVKLVEGVLTVVNRDLAKDVTSAAGEVLSLNKGKGVTLVSYPSEANIEIDGKFYGKTPLSIDTIASGEHSFALDKVGYLKRSIRAFVPPDYNLTLSVDLALSEADLTNIVTPPTTETAKVVVKSTPTGFLRVRDKAATSGQEIGRVSPGDELVLLEELNSWYRIRLQNGDEGYVSAAYVEKSVVGN